MLTALLAQLQRRVAGFSNFHRGIAFCCCQRINKSDVHAKFLTHAFWTLRQPSQHFQLVLEVTNRRLIRALLPGALGGRLQPSDDTFRFSGCACSPQVMREVVAVVLNRVTVELFEHIGEPQVEPLAARRRQLAENGPPDEFMGEMKPGIRILPCRSNQSSPFRVLDMVEQRVPFNLRRCFEQVEWEGAPITAATPRILRVSLLTRRSR